MLMIALLLKFLMEPTGMIIYYPIIDVYILCLSMCAVCDTTIKNFEAKTQQ